MLGATSIILTLRNWSASLYGCLLIIRRTQPKFLESSWRRLRFKSRGGGSSRQRRRRRRQQVTRDANMSISTLLRRAIQSFSDDQVAIASIGSLLSTKTYFLFVTPTSQLPEGPLPDQSNSVLRRFGNSLRISVDCHRKCEPKK